MHALFHFPEFPPSLSTHECGTIRSASHWLACLVHSPTGCSLYCSCPSLSLLPVWMNVSSLTPSIQFNSLPGLVVFCFYIGCCPSFGCARKQSISTYASILARSLLLGTPLPGFRSYKPPWLRLSQRPWDHKPLRRQSLSPWQRRHLCPLYFTLLGPEPDQLASEG